MVVLLVAWPAAAVNAVSDPIQPGDFMSAGDAACTLNFVYDGIGQRAGKAYIGTAAHCVHGLGEDVETLEGEIFGDVAYVGNRETTATDFALIEVRSGFLSRVSPAVKGHPRYPRGVTSPGETATGDLLQLSGYGLGFSLLPLTQQSRVAVLTSDDADTWQAAGLFNFGDSGGPLVHIRTGKALGVESRVCLGLCTDEGPTVQGILARAAQAGFPVKLRTVL